MPDDSSPSAKGLLTRYAAGERSFMGIEVGEPALDLSGAKLDGADFSEAYLVCDFRGASLRNARFCRANLKTCDFSHADLTDADFSGAAIDAANFEDAILTRACFAGAHEQGYILADGALPLRK